MRAQRGTIRLDVLGSSGLHFKLLRIIGSKSDTITWSPNGSTAKYLRVSFDRNEANCWCHLPVSGEDSIEGISHFTRNVCALKVPQWTYILHYSNN